ncbi:MAG: hypothetical protein KAW93_01240, partial [Methanogenium sp.]|nr:hypothetical protein [Methanogenium sp.]
CPEGKIMIAKISQNKQLRRIATGSLLFAIVVAAVLTAGCTGAGEDPSSEVTYTGLNVEKVELYHFYDESSRCISCVMLGDIAEEAVNTHYTEELRSGRLIFDHIDVGVAENSEIVGRYGPTGSSLWIGIYDENGFYAEELILPWYMIGDKPKFMRYIKAVLDPQLVLV